MSENHPSITVPRHVIEAAIAASQKATTAGAATGFFGWVAQNNVIGLGGLLLAFFGLLVNIYFQQRRDKREQKELATKIKALEAKVEYKTQDPESFRL